MVRLKMKYVEYLIRNTISEHVIIEMDDDWMPVYTDSEDIFYYNSDDVDYMFDIDDSDEDA